MMATSVLLSLLENDAKSAKNDFPIQKNRRKKKSPPFKKNFAAAAAAAGAPGDGCYLTAEAPAAAAVAAKFFLQTNERTYAKKK